LEESYETLDALDSGEPSRFCEELGDLLFQVLIHVQLAEEAGEFTMRDVLAGISGKLIRRHPHVFAGATAETPEDVIEQWDDLKARERVNQSALAGIPPSLPALVFAQALQRRASRAGFAYASTADAWQALEEELGELRAARTPGEQRDEAGDALFALANLVRHMDVDAEDALASTGRRFTDHFQRMEGITEKRGLDLKVAPFEVKLALWEEAKTLRE
jgi:tetrapyrrole methylase family protein/MazG family protein